MEDKVKEFAQDLENGLWGNGIKDLSFRTKANRKKYRWTDKEHFVKGMNQIVKREFGGISQGVKNYSTPFFNLLMRAGSFPDSKQ